MRLRVSIIVAALLPVCPPAPGADPAGPVPVPAAGLHNAFRLSDRLYSGSSPDGDAGFAELRRLGIKTVLTVDGSRPDVDAAHRHGLRYVHLPFGYDGIPRARLVELVKAARDLPGPIYVHCHHGQHRGPAAAAAIEMCLAGWDADRAAAWLKTAGTDPRYTGLVGLPRSLVPPTAAELARVKGEFPEVAPVPDLAKAMVDIDARWDGLKLVKAARWAAPPGHPDIDPPHEAVQLGEQFREAARLDGAKRRGPAFVTLLGEAESAAGALERALRARPADADRAAAAFARAQSACARCHDQFRDRPASAAAQ